MQRRAHLTPPMACPHLRTAGVAAGSCLINDYFDFASGTDQLNAPHKPLPSGTVKPDVAVLVAGGL